MWLQAAAESVCPVCDPCPEFNDAANYLGARNIIQCGIELLAVGNALGYDFTATCPAGLQAQIDSMYSNCDGGADWETEKPAWKSLAERKGCAGAAQAVPAVVLVAAAAVNHLLN